MPWRVGRVPAHFRIAFCAVLMTFVVTPPSFRAARSSVPVARLATARAVASGRAQGDAPRVPALPPRPAAPPPSRSSLDEPVDVVWPAVNVWSDAMEREYSAFVARLGEAVQARRCAQIAECLRDPSANTLYDPAADASLRLDVDCADLPYILRGYFAFKRRLPWGFVASVGGRANANGNRDPRYMVGVYPDGFRTWRQFATPRAVLVQMVGLVHSGMYRIAADVEGGDFYPVAIDRRAVVPGTTYYDPNGHVLVVASVRPDGTVYLIDGHPDGTLTWKRFGEAFAVGTRRLGGGFKNFRPLALVGDRLVRASNRELPRFDGESQWSEEAWKTAETGAAQGDAAVAPPRPSYHAWVRASLTEAGVVRDPVADFRDELRALCRDVADRAEAVEIALRAGIQRQQHPAALPWNIYGTDGDWELYSTPSRDARLKASFRELREAVAAVPAGSPLLPALRAVWAEETSRDECRFAYTSSTGARVTLTFGDVLDRLWSLSFDPYHCPELRWGAARGSAELAACADDGDKRGWYESERRLRNQIDRRYGVATSLDEGPDAPPDVDVRRLLDDAGVLSAQR